MIPSRRNLAAYALLTVSLLATRGSPAGAAVDGAEDVRPSS